MKKLGLAFAALLLLLLGFILVRTLTKTKIIINHEAGYAITGELIRDATGTYCSFEGNDDNGDSYLFYCLLCDADSFIEESLAPFKIEE